MTFKRFMSTLINIPIMAFWWMVVFIILAFHILGFERIAAKLSNWIKL
jgi:hypothetical protein